MRASVNGVEIAAAAIAAEAQNHPSPSPQAALDEAARALVVRELLLQRARAMGLQPAPRRDGGGRRETDEEALVRQVVEAEVDAPEADEETCRAYFEARRDRFVSPPLYEASHILFAADPADAPAREVATGKAEQVLAALAARPERFSELARALSDCPSGTNGGSLGQIARGDSVPEVETSLDSLAEGQICPVPVESRYGAHVLRLDHRIEERRLPFEAVSRRIARYLREAGWRRGVARYVRGLAEGARIEGADLQGTGSPG